MNRRDFINLSLANLMMQNEIAANPKADIIQRTIPSTGEKLPVVGLGTWRVFDVAENEKERQIRKEILKNLTNKGGRIIDTSPMYGSSQTVVGDLTAELKIRPNFFFANKVWTSGRQSGIEQINDSFHKMKTPRIDLMQVHNLVDVQTHLKTLRAMKEEGRIRYIGITHYLPSVYPEMIRLITTEKLDFVHFNYNIGSREAEKTLLPLAKEKGLAVIINRPFEEGQLFGVVRNKKLPEWAKAELDIQSWASFFLKYVISHSAVTCTIPATTQPNHLIENIQTAYGPLPDAKMREKMLNYFANS